MDRRLPRRQARIEAILTAAMTIATAEGLEALTIARLCEDLQLSIGGLYRYFPGKEAIYTALQMRTIHRFHGFWQQAVGDARTTLAEVGTPAPVAALVLVHVAFQAYLNHAVAMPVEHRLMDAFLSSPDQLLSDDEARKVDDDVLNPLIGDYAGLLVAAADCGALAPGDAVVRTHVIWAALHGLDHMRKRDRLMPDHLRVGALVPATLNAFLGGWGASPESLAAAFAFSAVSQPVT